MILARASGSTTLPSRRTGALQHFFGHIDADNLPLGPDLFGGDKAVEAAARPEIDTPLAGPQCALREWIADPCKRFNRALRHSGNNSFVVAQVSRQRASRMEMITSVRINRHGALFRFH